MGAQWDWTVAEQEYKRALPLNPNLSEAYLRYSALLSVLGRQEEALSMARRAQDLDPLDLRPRSREGGCLYFGRRYDEAIQKFDSILKLEPDDDASLVFQGYSYSAAGRYKEAIANYEKLIQGGHYSRAHVGKKSSLFYESTKY
jgi:tetratricopeptide (TPR) repeat protein